MAKAKTTTTVTSLKFHRLNDQVKLPIFSTKQSACFDIYANLITDDIVQYFSIVSKIVILYDIAQYNIIHRFDFFVFCY